MVLVEKVRLINPLSGDACSTEITPGAFPVLGYTF